jgi:hypothetical protein
MHNNHFKGSVFTFRTVEGNGVQFLRPAQFFKENNYWETIRIIDTELLTPNDLHAWADCLSRNMNSEFLLKNSQ